eukprot:7628818-Prorocentrum_lima.AAC.1
MRLLCAGLYPADGDPMARHAHTALLTCANCASPEIRYVWARPVVTDEAAALCQECMSEYGDRGG